MHIKSKIDLYTHASELKIALLEVAIFFLERVGGWRRGAVEGIIAVVGRVVGGKGHGGRRKRAG